MADFDYIIANDFDRAWLNFELDLPLEPGPNGEPNPFYVDRPGNPLAELQDSLLAPFFQPPKFFFSGHRGCGKSTELLRLAASPEINAKFWPIHFTIRDEADINDLDFRDVLLAIGGRLYRDYRAGGGKLPPQLIKELDSWRGQIETQVTTIIAGRTSESEIEVGLDAFFANAGLKMKLEPATRAELRQVFQRKITGLIQVINDIAAAIQSREKRLPLVLIDDLDKPDLEIAKEIFQGRREIMLQPNCSIVYTVSSALFYSKEFDAIRDRAIFLPNVKLHPHQKSAERDRDGYTTLRFFAHKRMDKSLIQGDTLDQAISNSGGVFREMARVMRSAIGRARRRKATQIEATDVEWAATEIRNEYRRILDKADIEFLRDVHRHNRLENHERLRPLLQLLALLEYRNAENWCDVHPALDKLLEEQPNNGNSEQS
jgi:hypothetical protein